MRKNKKASASDILLIGVLLLFISVFVLLGATASNAVRDKIVSMSVFDGTQSKDAVTATMDNFNNGFEYGFLFLTVGLALVTLIFAALVRVHPIFIPFYIIGLSIIIFFSAVFSNIYQKVAENSNVAATASSYPIINAIMVALPIIVGVFGTLLMIVMYKIWSIQQ